MRPVLLCVFLVCGLSTPASGQQLKEITNGIGMKLVLIHAGSFTMGSPEGEVGRKDDETQHELQHKVTISKSYYLGVNEVTQEQYERVMGVNPSKFKGAKNPVEQVSWKDAVSFCRILTDMPKEKAAGRAFRLPTEAEWEYACRATSSAAFCFGDSAESLEEYGWFRDGLVGITHSVGMRRPNRWGLYDMHGNVSEWCQDEYEPYTSSEETDPQGPSVGSSRVFRGGGWFNAAGHCRSAHRQRQDLSQRYSFCGFRVAMSLPAKQPASTPSK